MPPLEIPNIAPKYRNSFFGETHMSNPENTPENLLNDEPVVEAAAETVSHDNVDTLPIVE